MASNFWTSSHWNMRMSRDEVGKVQPADHDRGLTPEDVKVIKIHLSCYIKTLATHAKVRQRVVATAVTYFRRVYTRKSFTELDPRLVAPTCLYLASKAEESTIQAKILVFCMKKFRTVADDKYRIEIKDVLEMEMKLLEALDFYLVIYHPYRPLIHMLQDAGLTDLTQHCWTDLILIYPPHMIALACILLACVIKDRDTRMWFEELRVDMNVVKDISMDMLDFYENYRQVSDQRVVAAFSKLPQRV
eukprot:TRINITY_DN1454_c0_g2_i1.p1 TRINITY_DN1454_c0_g2~~TRINITY_DN1454_c0_g2_i1.p1  ORF type:complete len:246 (-),score=34.75 TRINITY_DN1454_c0_g2_i1:132-869(-)